MTNQLQGSNSEVSAVLDYLVYSKALDNPKESVKTLYDNFYDKQGNLLSAEIIGEATHSYLESNGSQAFQKSLQSLKMAGSVNQNNYVGIAVTDANGQAFLSSRGSNNLRDWVTNATIGISEHGVDIPIVELPVLETATAKAFADKVYKDHKNLVLSGHSQAGEQAQQQAAYLMDQHPEAAKTIEVNTFNSPQAGRSIKDDYGVGILNQVALVTTNHNIEGDIVHLIGEPVGRLLIFHSTATNFIDKHSSALFVTSNATDFNTTYINSDNSINVENVSNAYNDIVAKEAVIMTEMANSDTNSWFDYIRSAIPDSVEGLLGATNYSAQLAEIALQKAGLAEILKGAVTSFEGEIEFWSQEFSEYNTELAETLHLNRCIDPTMLFDAMAEQTESSILEFIGGNTNKKILDTIVDSIKLQDTPEAQEQFLNSLENGGLLDSLLGSDATDSLGIKSVDKLVLEKFQQASTQRYGDPLVVDLDGDGLETVGANGQVLFDHDNDGVATGTGWAGADDGLLVRDIDGSGTIDTGRELFGDNTLKADGTKAKDGFDALRDLDSNSDGVFDNSDTAFDEVQVWQDADQDGVTDEGELTSLADAGISSIDLNAKTVNKSVAGGILRKTSTATKVDGTTAAVGAMDFAENKFYSKFEEVLQSSQDLQNSINVAGQGALRSLHESASQSPKLNELLKELYSGGKEISDASAHQVLLEWARTATNFTTSLDLLDGYTLEDGTQVNVLGMVA